MFSSPWQWLWPLAFYLVGSIPTGYLLGKARGLDIREHGSGNIGATNVWRVMGWKWGLPAFILDFLKGFLPLFMFRGILYPAVYLTQTSYVTNSTVPIHPPITTLVERPWTIQLLLVLCGLAAVIGHNYTPWLGFKGGKGIATTAGVLAALMPLVLAVAFTLWAVLTLITRYVSVGSIVAAASLAPLAWFFYRGQWILFALAGLAGVLAIYRHKTNIQRLLAGTESKIGKKKDAP